ncbi:MAG: phosphatidate cytidylyltransferase [Rickettsiales bacterium]|nr:phosphatidate cytidylyltransferase [Rickettsiales bacterium]MCA0254554.1 phosphatidate cytidylyltransferase [Pseudomonadota bacterium]
MINNNFLIRCISGLVIGLAFVVTIFYLRPLFYILLYLINIAMLMEWYDITKSSRSITLLGLVAVPIPLAAVLLMSYVDQSGWLLITYFVLIWTVDTMAMIGGKALKGPKLAPKISPQKTISGLLTGVISAVILVNFITLIPGYRLPYMFELSNIGFSVYVLILGFAAQLSDLSISVVKRHFNIKDSGTLIPGHGGFLDRFDSLIITAPLVGIYILINTI